MQIKTLKIHNIASIEDAQIDFGVAPLADDPLFLITGETGSGKTTILNAICLALYNQVPALKSIGTAEEDREGLQTDNPRQLLRRGTGEAEIELSFVGNNLKSYRAVWRVQRARKKITGKYQSVVRQLHVVEDGAEIVYTRKDEIESQIKAAIGLTFEQFTRTTLLAQGQFATFMKASDNDKSEILEKLTGTEIYARIGRRVYGLMQEKVEEFKAIDNQIKGVTLLNDEEKESIRQRAVHFDEKIKQCDAHIKVIDSQIGWLNERAAMQAALDKKIEARLSARQCVEADEYVVKKKTIADWDATEEIRSMLAQEAAENKVLAGLRGSLADMNDVYARISGGIGWLKLQLDKKSVEKSALDDVLDREAENIDMYANVPTIKTLAEKVADFINEQRDCTKERDEIEAKLKKSQAAEAEKLCAAKNIADKYQRQAHEVKKCEDRLEGIELSALTREVNALVEEMAQVEKAMSSILKWRQGQTEWQDAERLLRESLDAQATLQKEIDRYREMLPALKERHAAKLGYLEGQMRLNDHIRELRERFSESGVCPLCGSHAGDLHSDDMLAEYLAAARSEEEIARKSLDAANAALTKAEVGLKTLASTVKLREADAVSKRGLCDRLEQEAKSAYADYAATDAVECLEAKYAALAKRKKEKQSDLDIAAEHHKAVASARKELDSLQIAKDDAEKEHQKQAQCSSELGIDLKAKTDMIAVAKKKADDDLAAIKKMLAADIEISLYTVGDVCKGIEQRAKTYERNKGRAQQLAETIDKITAQVADNESRLAGIKDRFEADTMADPAEMPGLSAAINDFVGAVNSLVGKIEQTSMRIASFRRKIDDYFSTPGSQGKDRVEALGRLQREDIAECKRYVETADKRFADACAAVNTIKEQLATHTAKRPDMPEDATADALAEIRRGKSADRDEAGKEYASLCARLDEDKKAAASIAEKCALRDRLRKEKDNWEMLDKAFGGADGKKFRNIAQSYVLRALLSRANYYLYMLNKRYKLDCDDGSLTINVIDRHQGDAVRNVGLLSGGEGFVVSLALALGLSSISGNSLNVDTLFIDEGFGTLSSDYLETVINTLDRLHQHAGRRVGIISHVDGLKERIPTQICLQRTGPSSSKVTVVSL